jgi:integrase/recombinase XerC
MSESLININNYLSYLELEKRYSKHTITSYKRDLLDFKEFIDEFYQLPMNQIELTHVRSYMVSLLEKELAKTSVSRKISSVKSFFKYLLKENIIESSPVHLIETPKLEKRLPVFIKEDELTKLFEEIQYEEGLTGIRDKLILTLFYQTGMRLSELINLKLSDLHEGEIKVLGKRNKERIIPLTKGTISLIDLYLFERGDKFSSNSYLIVTDKGNKLYEKFVYRKVNYYLSLVSSKQKKSPHILRHTFATHMLNNGADLNAIKELLGHENLAATQIYTHNTFQKLKSIHEQSHPRG